MLKHSYTHSRTLMYSHTLSHTITATLMHTCIHKMLPHSLSLSHIHTSLCESQCKGHHIFLCRTQNGRRKMMNIYFHFFKSCQFASIFQGERGDQSESGSLGLGNLRLRYAFCLGKCTFHISAAACPVRLQQLQSRKERASPAFLESKLDKKNVNLYLCYYIKSVKVEDNIMLLMGKKWNNGEVRQSGISRTVEGDLGKQLQLQFCRSEPLVKSLGLFEFSFFRFKLWPI